MKIEYRGKEVTVSEAVSTKLYPDAYTYEGELEKMKRQIELQAELIAKLVDVLCVNRNIRVNELEEILGFGYSLSD